MLKSKISMCERLVEHTEDMRIAYKILVGKPEGRSPLKRTKVIFTMYTTVIF
jgi:hypothetical protein